MNKTNEQETTVAAATTGCGAARISAVLHARNSRQGPLAVAVLQEESAYVRVASFVCAHSQDDIAHVGLLAQLPVKPCQLGRRRVLPQLHSKECRGALAVKNNKNNQEYTAKSTNRIRCSACQWRTMGMATCAKREGGLE